MKRLIYLLVALPVLMLAGCDKEELPGGEQQGTESKICFDIGIGTATATPQLRSVTYSDFTSAFETGDQVGLYIVKGNGGLQASGNWVDNLSMTFNGTGWTYTLPASKEYFPSDGSTLSFYAYYPYNAMLSNPLAMSFTVQVDQSTAANSSASDLMMASSTGVARTSAAIPLTFSHKLAMVQVAVTNGGPGAIMTEEVLVLLKGCKPEATANLATGSISATGSSANIVMQRVEQSADANYLTKYTYRALVPQQAIASGVEMLNFSQGNVMLKHLTTAATTFNSGEARKYDITLNVTLDPSHVYAVGDIYPYKGFPMGVIFEISNGGKNGKIVHKDETNAAWGPTNVTGATNQNDGSANMATIQAISGWGTNYPAFKWCADKGSGWYLPAENELSALYTVWNTDRVSFNGKLTTAGGTGLSSDYYYWSSTEISDFNAEVVYFNDGVTYHYIPKHHNYSRVRAVLAF